MNETERILQLFKDLFDGDPWLDVNLLSTLAGIDAEQASRRIAEGRNTIWEIVNHVTQWRLNILERFKGQVIPSPEHNYILPVKDTSEVAWQGAIKELSASQDKWIAYLEKADEEELMKVYPGNKGTHYYHVHGILQHDAYHLGQIVLLAKLV